MDGTGLVYNFVICLTEEQIPFLFRTAYEYHTPLCLLMIKFCLNLIFYSDFKKTCSLCVVSWPVASVFFWGGGGKYLDLLVAIQGKGCRENSVLCFSRKLTCKNGATITILKTNIHKSFQFLCENILQTCIHSLIFTLWWGAGSPAIPQN